MGGVNLLDVFPAGVLLFPALYAAVKIAAGVLVLYFGKGMYKRAGGGNAVKGIFWGSS